MPVSGIIMPVMGMEIERQIKPSLFNKTRAALLALFFAHIGEEFYVNQVMQLINCGSGAVQHELGLLTDAGILRRERKGNLVFYRANDKSPIVSEMKSLFAKGVFTTTAPPKPSAGSGKLQLRRKSGIKIPRVRIAEFCRRHHISRLSFFGSVLTKDFRPDSDIDVLVEFEPGHTPGWEIVQMEDELASILSHRVDMHTREDLSRYFRDRVVREAEVQYSSG